MELRSSIFGEDWWLDAAAPGDVEHVAVVRDGVTQGVLHFHRRRRFGLTYLTMPPLTRTMSPFLAPLGDRPVSRALNALSVVGELMDKLPPHDRFETTLDPGCPSLQGFVHNGCAVTHTFTYRGKTGLTPEALLEDAHRKTRNVIAKARRNYEATWSGDIERFIRLHALEFGAVNQIDYATLGRIFSAARDRGRADIVFIAAEGLKDVAAAILVWDATHAYYWLTARDPASGANDANSLAIIESVGHARAGGRAFDLDGYATPATSVFLMKFGLTPVVRPFVNRSNGRWKMLNALSRMRGGDRVDLHSRV
ncbi:MAG: GNAT family N-acetyltransferase [Alphaproteobacteria bacterium]|nr:GNAT family N-acetyltransferase [Alphaproteobacteria bacterium]